MIPRSFGRLSERTTTIEAAAKRGRLSDLVAYFLRLGLLGLANLQPGWVMVK